MKRVYINERSEVELKLMTYATKEAFESGPISGCQSLPDLKARLREYCQGEGHLEPPFVMINLDGEEEMEEYTLPDFMESLRDMESCKDAYFLIWTHPLRKIPSWSNRLGRGSFAQKPFELQALTELIQQKIKEGQILKGNGH